jgi:hypothetical protein
MDVFKCLNFGNFGDNWVHPIKTNHTFKISVTLELSAMDVVREIELISTSKLEPVPICAGSNFAKLRPALKDGIYHGVGG